MASYLSLEEAAAKLGIPTDRLVELRSQGQVRGFRDGSSWKFPENEVERLADEFGDSLAGGSGILVDENDLPAPSAAGSADSNIIGDDDQASAAGSDLQIGDGSDAKTDSDVNLVASDGTDSDVAVVSGEGADAQAESGSKSKLKEIDSADLKLEEPAIMHDSGELELSLESDDDSTGAKADDADRREAVIGGDDSDLDLLGSDATADQEGADAKNAQDESAATSNLELMPELDTPKSQDAGGSPSASNADVLSGLESEQQGSDLISGDSDLLGLSGIGSDVSGSGSGVDDALSNDDALDDDDDLVIADDDDDLVLDSGGSDISIAGDSGINLMSPSDSGLSLESEPLDMAGSSISALDLGAEVGGSGSGSGISGGSGSAVDFQADEEFQLSPSGVGLESDEDSGSQVIEIEDSEAIAEPVEFGDVGFDDAGEDDVFAAGDEEGGFDDGGFEDEGVGIDPTAEASPSGAPRMGGYEVPFTTLQVVALAMILCILSLGGMLMTDLVRNMWAYSEVSAPVSSLTDSLISLMGWGE